MKNSSFTLALAFMLPLASEAYDCKYTRDIVRELPANSIQELQVRAGAGTLSIMGEASNEIRIEAKVCADKESDLDKMEIKVQTFSDSVLIETEIPGSGWGDNDRKGIDLHMRVPARLKLDVEDSSGSAKVSGVSSLEIEDSSGSLTIKNIAGDVDVKDSSGSVSFENIDGGVVIKDSSGSINASNVAQDFHVKADSSGSINASNIGGSVIVDRDSSGSINANNVEGDFVVKLDGSGSINYQNVKGNVDIPENKRD